jgi:HEAT repeats/HEAT repeat associated with sister chromatid cohesion
MNRRALQGALVLLLSVLGGCEIGGYDLPQYQCPPPGCCESGGCQTLPCCPPPCGIACAPCTESAPSPESRPDPFVAIRSTDRRAQEIAIAELAEQGGNVLAQVEALLFDPSPNVRWAALQVLVRMREAAAPSVYAVKSLLRDCDPGIRADAASVLGLAGCAAGEAVSELTCALEDSSPIVRYRVAVAFQRLGEAGEPGRTALERHSHCDRDPRVREAAACALYMLDHACCRERRY